MSNIFSGEELSGKVSLFIEKGLVKDLSIVAFTITLFVYGIGSASFLTLL